MAACAVPCAHPGSDGAPLIVGVAAFIGGGAAVFVVATGPRWQLLVCTPIGGEHVQRECVLADVQAWSADAAGRRICTEVLLTDALGDAVLVRGDVDVDVDAARAEFSIGPVLHVRFGVPRLTCAAVLHTHAGTLAVAGTHRGALIVADWCGSAEAVVWTLARAHAGPVYAVQQCAQYAGALMSGGEDGLFHFWDVVGGTLVRRHSVRSQHIRCAARVVRSEAEGGSHALVGFSGADLVVVRARTGHVCGRLRCGGLRREFGVMERWPASPATAVVGVWKTGGALVASAADLAASAPAELCSAPAHMNEASACVLLGSALGATCGLDGRIAVVSTSASAEQRTLLRVEQCVWPHVSSIHGAALVESSSGRRRALVSAGGCLELVFCAVRDDGGAPAASPDAPVLEHRATHVLRSKRAVVHRALDVACVSMPDGDRGDDKFFYAAVTTSMQELVVLRVDWRTFAVETVAEATLPSSALSVACCFASRLFVWCGLTDGRVVAWQLDAAGAGADAPLLRHAATVPLHAVGVNRVLACALTARDDHGGSRAVWLVTCGDDQDVRQSVWRCAPTSECACACEWSERIALHGAAAVSAAVLPEQQLVVSLGADQRVLVVRCDPLRRGDTGRCVAALATSVCDPGAVCARVAPSGRAVDVLCAGAGVEWLRVALETARAEPQ